MGLNGRPICVQTFTKQKDIVFLLFCTKEDDADGIKAIKQIDVLEQ